MRWAPWILVAFFLRPQLSLSALSQGSKDKAEWPSLAEEEQKWSVPGLHAGLLYREEHTNLEKSYSTHFYRVKILTNEGRRYGNIEIVYSRGVAEVKDIQARTIQPDGSAIPFRGQVFDKPIARVRKLRLLAKTFTLPDVQVGSILEYRYRLEWKGDSTPAMHWTVDHQLYTHRARFSLRPYSVTSSALNWRSKGLVGKQPVWQGEVQVLEIGDLPPFRKEELMPPEEEVRPSLEFYYQAPMMEYIVPVEGGPKEMLDDFWTRVAKFVNEKSDKFMDKDRALRETVAAVAPAGDPPDARLRKLYERAQKIRNLSYLPPKSNAEADKLVENKNVEEVLRRGYGNDSDIAALFVALARAAGFETSLVLVPERDRTFFAPEVHRIQSLNGELTMVKIGSEQRFFDPGSLYCPFGLISWEKTAVQGIRLVKGGGLWVHTPKPVGADTRIRRTLRLHTTDQGRLEGDLRVGFTGQEALRRRQEAQDQDDLGRRKDLENEIKRWLPDGSFAEVGKAGPWDQAEPPLEAEIHVRVSGMIASTVRRMIIPLSVLRAGNGAVFRSTFRAQPVYIPYFYREDDEVVLEIPPGYQVESLPGPGKIETAFGRCETSHELADREIRFRRQEAVEGILQTGSYRELRGFFEAMRVSDENRTVLQVVAGH